MARLPCPKTDVTSLSRSLGMLVSPVPLPVPTSNDPTHAVQHQLLLHSAFTPSSVAAFKASASPSIFAEPLCSHTGVGLIQPHGMIYVCQFSTFSFFTLCNVRKFCEIKHSISSRFHLVQLYSGEALHEPFRNAALEIPIHIH